MLRKALGFIATAGLLASISAQASAQTTKGALQLGLGTDVLTYTNASATVHFPPATGDVTGKTGTTRWGFSNRSALSLEGGYGLGESLVLGGIVGLGGWSRTIDLDRNDPNNDRTKQSTFDLFIAPKLDYMLMPGERIRPFFGGAIGVAYQSETTKVSRTNGGTVTLGDTSTTGLAVMLRAGARFFLTPGFSLDPAFTFMWIPTATGSYLDNDRIPGPAVTYDMSAHSYALGLTLAASGWVGL